MAAASPGARGHSHLFFSSLEGKGARRVGVCSHRAQRGGSGCSLSSKTSPFVPTFIVSPPVYSHTAFLDVFFWRAFPYTQTEATRVLRTRGESSPLSKETSRVGAEISTCFIRRVPDPRRVRKESPRDERRREVMAASEQSVLLKEVKI